MSYNIMGKNASFKGDTSGTIENQVNDWDTQTIGGNKTFTNAITSSASVMISGSGKVSASFFYGNGSGLSGVATAAGDDRQVQFNDGGSSLGASGNFTFTSTNIVSVTGQVSASLGITGSEFYGDGSNLTAVTASFVTASNVNGILNASQVNIGDGLEDSSNAIRVKLTSSSGLGRTAGGMSLDVHGLAAGSYSDASRIALGVSSGDTKQIPLSALEQNLNISGSNIVGDQSIPNARLQNTVSVVNVTASGHVSASTFHGNGSALIGVTSTPTPAGSNTQVQFNDDGAIAADAQLTFLTGSNTLTTTILSASAHVSASSYGGVAGTLIDSAGNFAGNNASFAEITASSVISSSANISGAAFFGDGNTLSNVPLGTYSNGNIVFCDSTADTITSNNSLQWTGTKLTATGLSASANVEIGGNLLIGGQTLSSAELGVLDGVTAGTATASKAMVLDSDADITGFRKLKSATDNGSSLEITGAVGVLQLTLEGVQYKNNTNTSTARFLPTGIISASADLQVGGHITGSGNIVLGNNNNNKILWDTSGGSNEGPYIHGVSASSGVGATKKLEIHGDDDLNLMADSIIRIKVPDDEIRMTIQAASVSSSVPITASALFLQDSPGSAVISSGGNTFLDNNGNINTGGITMQSEGSLVLNFNDNSISGSGNISGSQFYGDGSNLTGVGGESLSLFRWNYAGNMGSTTTAFLTSTEDASGASYDGSLRRWRFPYSGSISFVTIEDAGQGTGQFEVFMQKIDSSNSVTLVGQSTGSTGDAGSGTLNVTGSCDCSGDNTFTTGSFAFGAGEFFTITVTNREHTGTGNLLTSPRGLVAFSLNPANKL
jgi:hypothetical protein